MSERSGRLTAINRNGFIRPRGSSFKIEAAVAGATASEKGANYFPTTDQILGRAVWLRVPIEK